MRSAVIRVVVSVLAAAVASAGWQSAAARQATPLVWTKPDQFWFVKVLAGGPVWINVDAEHGVKEPLFDHQRLAIELTIRTGIEFTAQTLPFVDPAARFVVKYDGSNAYIQEGAMAVEFVLAGQFWRCDLQTKWNWNKVPPTDYECLSRGAAAAAPPVHAEPAVVTSPDGSWRARIERHNVVIERDGAAPIALGSDGVAGNAYQAGSLRWGADSRTVSAWRVHASVWESESLTGNVRSLVAKRSWTVPAGRAGAR